MRPFKYNPDFNSGTFRHKITIFKEANGQDDDGFPVENARENVCTVWSAIKTVKGSEYISSAATQAEVTNRFIIRFREGIDTRMKIEYKGRIFDIVIPPINDNEMNKTLTIVAKERV
ncbi:TPA: phage head closure protein [Salmonella enterica subsp. enterica serovar Typhi str. AG3]|nr:phage head closure protein [Salmonella enterica subsp. enterica serovar Typhi str. AG3]